MAMKSMPPLFRTLRAAGNYQGFRPFISLTRFRPLLSKNASRVVYGASSVAARTFQCRNMLDAPVVVEGRTNRLTVPADPRERCGGRPPWSSHPVRNSCAEPVADALGARYSARPFRVRASKRLPRSSLDFRQRPETCRVGGAMRTTTSSFGARGFRLAAVDAKNRDGVHAERMIR